jgi:hypothetical protein
MPEAAGPAQPPRKRPRHADAADAGGGIHNDYAGHRLPASSSATVAVQRASLEELEDPALFFERYVAARRPCLLPAELGRQGSDFVGLRRCRSLRSVRGCRCSVPAQLGAVVVGKGEARCCAQGAALGVTQELIGVGGCGQVPETKGRVSCRAGRTAWRRGGALRTGARRG